MSLVDTNAFDYINVLDKAADASWLRNDDISNNIANADTPEEEVMYLSSAALLIYPNSTNTAGMLVWLSTRSPAWCTPLSTRLAVVENCFCIIFERLTLAAMFWSCISSKMM